jgi:hypothetical protein
LKWEILMDLRRSAGCHSAHLLGGCILARRQKESDGDEKNNYCVLFQRRLEFDRCSNT